MSGQPWGTPDGADGGTGGPDGGGLTEADRDQAVAALDVHRDAGRLDDVGFEERSVRARRAYTRADLDLLFLDLPEPHAAPAAPSWGAPSAGSSPAPQHPAPQQWQQPQPYADPRRPLVSPELARKIVAAAPIVAFALFWFTHQWVFFLVVPLAGVFFGNGKRDRRRR